MLEYVIIRHRVRGDITSENYRESDDRIHRYAVRTSAILVAREPVVSGFDATEYTVELHTPTQKLCAIGTQSEMEALFTKVAQA